MSGQAVGTDVQKFRMALGDGKIFSGEVFSGWRI